MVQEGGEAAEGWLPWTAPEFHHTGQVGRPRPHIRAGGVAAADASPALHQRGLSAGQVSTTRPTLRGKHMMTRFLLWLLWYLFFYQNPCVSGASFGPSCIRVNP